MKSVFVVDDHIDYLKTFEVWVDDRWDVHYYPLAELALNDVQKYSPSVIISDAQMPGIHGLEFLNLIKLISNEIKMICVSAYTRDEIIKKFGNIDGVTYFKKPLQKADYDKITKVIDSSPILDLRDSISGELLSENLSRLKKICSKYAELEKALDSAKSEYDLVRLFGEMNTAFKVVGIESDDGQKFLLKKWGLLN